MSTHETQRRRLVLHNMKPKEMAGLPSAVGFQVRPEVLRASKRLRPQESGVRSVRLRCRFGGTSALVPEVGRSLWTSMGLYLEPKHDRCFDRKRPSLGWFLVKNRGHSGSRLYKEHLRGCAIKPLKHNWPGPVHHQSLTQGMNSDSVISGIRSHLSQATRSRVHGVQNSTKTSSTVQNLTNFDLFGQASMPVGWRVIYWHLGSCILLASPG